MKISVIVTNWNGRKLLKKYLPKIIKNSPEAQEIILADDCSEDDSLSFVADLQKKYPRLKILSHAQNVGFGQNSNDAVNMAKGDLVVLLNSDINPYPDYLKPALKHFSDPELFGVGLCEKGRENWGKIFWKSGYLQYQPGLPVGQTHISAWLSGGSSIINRQHFLRLGGFDPIYQPFYSEDLDLGYRAWKSGYKILWEPKCLIEHKHEATTSKFPKRFLDYVKERNRLLTVWRNIDDPKLLQSNRLALIGRVFSGPNYIKIILAARRQVGKYPPPIVFPKFTDQQIFQLFQ
jgi:GT2 family glycosyltransferase